MGSSLAKRTPKKGKRSKRTERPRKSWWGRLFRFGVYTGFLVSLGVAGYLLYLDRNITKTFEGRRWSVPAQLYARPTELYPTARISLVELETELKRLGYRLDPNLTTPGTFKRRGRQLDIHLRDFRFMERHRSAQRITVYFNGDEIRQLTGRSGDIPLLRLDPAVIGSFFPSHGEDRIILTPDEVPELLAEGLKAIEDRGFDKHVGFSLRGILRALVANIRSGERAQGGSTLTQQLVKSYYLDNRRTYERKLQEVAMAFILDARFSKEDILTAYVNEIFLGQNGARAIHGFGLGAQFYFNKPLTELDPDEIATMISIIRGPSFYNPFRHPERALERRNRILNTFHKDGLIDETQFNVAVAQPIGVVASPNSAGAYYPAFLDQVRAELKEVYDSSDLSSRGLRIFTTIDPRLQDDVQRSITRTLGQIETDRRIDSGALQAAAIVADTQTGEIQALVGGRKGRVDGFNRALSAQRPVGSLIKPVVYLVALEQGHHLASIVKDEPLTLTPPNGQPWSPKNFDGEYRGDLPLVRALAQSLNLATVHLGTTIGLDHVQNRFADLVGRAPRNRYPSLLLGAEDLSPMEMLGLYGNFASNGFRTRPKAVIAVLDERGRPLTHHPFDLTQTIQSGDVAAINRALEIVMAKGTGRSSPFARQGIAGKTGTSNDNRDSWFAGFDNTYLSVVWVGRDDNEVTGLTGASGALRVWNNIARQQPITPLQHPPGPELVAVEFDTGLRAAPSCADVVMIPVPDKYELPIKPGCGIRTRVRDRIRRWLGN